MGHQRLRDSMIEVVLEILAEVGVSCCVEVFLSLFDGFALVKSAPNRRVRRTAKKAGAKPPPRDRWSWAAIILTTLVVVLGAVIVIGCIVQNMRGMR